MKIFGKTLVLTGAALALSLASGTGLRADDSLPTALPDGISSDPSLYRPTETATSGNGWAFSGAATFAARFYPNDTPLPDWADWVYDHFSSLEPAQIYPIASGWGRAVHTSDDGRHRFTAEIYGRYDIENDQGMVDLPEFNYFYDGGSWNVLAGSHKVFWGVAESRHVVDIINQIDRDGDPATERRLGQPMINYNVVSDYGTFSLFGLVGFREQDLDWLLDRFPTSKLIDAGLIADPEFEDDDWRHAAFAARYSNTLDMSAGSFDYALSFYTGTARNPRFEPGKDLGETPPVFLVPVYDHIDQVGAEALYVYNDWQVKFEGIWRRQNGEDVYAGVAGLEYALPSMMNSMLEVSLVGEYLYDSRDPVFGGTDFDGKKYYNATTLVDNNVFAGLRLGVNNGLNSNALGGVVFDLDDDSLYFTLEGSTLITDNFQVSVEGRFFNLSKDNMYYFLDNEDFLEVAITRFF